MSLDCDLSDVTHILDRNAIALIEDIDINLNGTKTHCLSWTITETCSACYFNNDAKQFKNKVLTCKSILSQESRKINDNEHFNCTSVSLIFTKINTEERLNFVAVIKDWHMRYLRLPMSLKFKKVQAEIPLTLQERVLFK